MDIVSCLNPASTRAASCSLISFRVGCWLLQMEISGHRVRVVGEVRLVVDAAGGGVARPRGGGEGEGRHGAVAVNDVPIDVLAERLNTTRGAIYKTIHDARHKLRAVLAARGLSADQHRGTKAGERT